MSYTLDVLRRIESHPLAETCADIAQVIGHGDQAFPVKDAMSALKYLGLIYGWDRSAGEVHGFRLTDAGTAWLADDPDGAKLGPAVKLAHQGLAASRRGRWSHP